MGLDKVGLQILATAGDSEKERRYAKVLIPVREKGNWLLCTLLIANTIANTFLPILIASFAGGIYGFIGSTILILVLAEIAPQAICSRYGLVLAARMIYVIYFFMAVLAPVAWPLSWVLDKILGREVGTIYSRAELKHLITIHVENPEHQEESGREFFFFFFFFCRVLLRERERGRQREKEKTTKTKKTLTRKKNKNNFFTVTREDYKVISGALDIRDKRVRDVMTRVDKVFMLDASTRLNFDEMLTIYKSGEKIFFFFFFFPPPPPPQTPSLDMKKNNAKQNQYNRLHPHPGLGGPPTEHHRDPLHERPDPRRPRRRGRGPRDHRAAGLRERRRQ